MATKKIVAIIFYKPKIQRRIRIMTKLRNIASVDVKKHLLELRSLFEELAEKDVHRTNSGFSADKDAILKVFELTGGSKKEDILVRLTLIDSMYSTQMGRRYYALEELADFLAKLASKAQVGLAQMFIDFAKSPEENSVKFDNEGENLFSKSYGIGKDGNSKGVAISLISKYAYFETKFKFPIYDSIACEMYPLVWHYCGFNGESPKLIYTIDTKIDGKKTLVEYLKAINLLIQNLNSAVLNYDLLDRFLWFVGKIYRGNLSLILTCEEYKSVLQIYPPQKVKKTKNKEVIEYFNIARIDIDKLTFLENLGVLRKLFEIAQYYKKQQ